MSSAAAKAAEKRTEEVREIRKKECNKTCCDCGERGPQNVVINFATFVCTMCSGIHREFEHRVKGISAAVFDENEVKALREGGNDVAKALWRAKYRESEFVVPDPSENRAIREKRVRDFIKMTYIDKRWVKDSGKSKSSASSSAADEKKKKKKKKVESSSEESSSESESSSSEEEEPEPTPKKKKKDKKKKEETPVPSPIPSPAPIPAPSEEKKKKKKKKGDRSNSPTPPLKALTDVLPDIGQLVVKPAMDSDSEEESHKKKKEKKSKKEKAAPAVAAPKSTAATNLLDFSFDSAPAASAAPSNDWANFDSAPSSSSSGAAAPAAVASGWANFDSGFGGAPASHAPAASTNFFDMPNTSAQPSGGFFQQSQPQGLNFMVSNLNAPPPAAAAAPAPAAAAPPAHAAADVDPFADLMGASSNAGSSHDASGSAPSLFPPTTPVHPTSSANSNFASPQSTHPPPSLSQTSSPMAANPFNMLGGPLMGGPASSPTTAQAGGANPMAGMNPMMMGMNPGGAGAGGAPGQQQMTPQMQQFMMQQMMMQQQMYMQMMMQAQQRGGAGGAGAPGGQGGAGGMPGMPMMNPMMMNPNMAGAGGMPGAGGATPNAANPNAAGKPASNPNLFANLF